MVHHALKRRHQAKRNHHAKRFAVADIETDPFKYGRFVKPFCCGFYDGKSLLVWWGEDCIVHLLAHCKKFRGLVYLHNGGKFDLHHFLEHADPEDFGHCFPIGSRIVRLSYGACEFRDSYALIPKPLASWEKDVVDYRKFLKHRREKHKIEILTYLKGDLRGLYSMLAEFFERYGRQLTLASTTIKILEKEFKIRVPKLTERDDAWFRKWYFAGRVQFWTLGRHTGRFAIYDINSAFPWAMTKDHWFSSGFWEGAGWPKKRKEQALYLVECPGMGALPFRNEDKSISFPLEPGKFYVTGWELLVWKKHFPALPLKVIWHWRPKRVQTFKRYVLKFYRLKKNAKNKADRYFAKLLLNALYGKFGSDPRTHREVSIRPWRKPPKGKDGKTDKTWQVAYDDRKRGITFYEKDAKVIASKFYNVAISASITGCVRAFLFDAIMKSRPVYCDTDSLITKKKPDNIGDGLGQWKKEMTCDVIWLGGKKLYVAHDAAKPWRKKKPKGKLDEWEEWVFVPGFGWGFADTKKTENSDFKTASKGVRLKVSELIHVCEGRKRTGRFKAPSYSIFRATSFTRRTIRRADKRNERVSHQETTA